MVFVDICIDEFDVYSCYFGRKGMLVNDMVVIMLFFLEIVNESVEKILSLFKCWVDEVIFVKEGLVLVVDFWVYMNVSCFNKINKKEVDLMQVFVLKMGYGLVFDLYYYYVKVDVDGIFVLFFVVEGGCFLFFFEFILVVMMFRLGVMVVLIDDFFD